MIILLSHKTIVVFLFFSLITFISVALSAPSNKNIVKLSDVSPSTIEFAWDLHETLVTIDTKGMTKTFIKSMASKDTAIPTIKFIAGVFLDYPLYKIFGTVGSRQRLINEMYALYIKGSLQEDYFDLVQRYNPVLRKVAEEMAAAYVEIQGIHELLHELNELGYTQRLASNIGQGIELNNIKVKFPHLFKYLNGGKTARYDNGKLIAKPDIKYFQEYQAEYNPAGNKIILFLTTIQKAKEIYINPVTLIVQNKLA